MSRDTHEIFGWLKYAQTLVAEQKDSTSVDFLFFACFHWWQRIIETRHRVFWSFYKALASDSIPALWLSFQLDCNERDPFVDIFRILALFDTSVLSRTDSDIFQHIALFKRRLPSRPDKYGTFSDHPPSFCGNDAIEAQYPERSDEFEVQWMCIDEAQEDLETIVAYKAPILDTLPKASILRNTLFDAPDLPMNILTIAMYAISHGAPFGTFPYFQQMIFCGTSLNVNRVL